MHDIYNFILKYFCKRAPYMAELRCPVCKSDSYLNPGIKIFISPCFHKICEQCLFKLFMQGTAPCPECHIPLRRINFITATFENLEIEQEIKIRKLLRKKFLRRPDEFQTEAAYNDYLEEFENLVFDMVECKNEPSSTAKLLEAAKAMSCFSPSVHVRHFSSQTDTFLHEQGMHWTKYTSKQHNCMVIDIDPDTNPLLTECSPGGLVGQSINSLIYYFAVKNYK
ncbi:CDK-activating kinase assembly factor MAT1 [Enteropsectra breve]|nr:CDK-activating kinase assembly factor MAT1 [Enteropsectra breve]